MDLFGSPQLTYLLLQLPDPLGILTSCTGPRALVDLGLFDPGA